MTALSDTYGSARDVAADLSGKLREFREDVDARRRGRRTLGTKAPAEGQNGIGALSSSKSVTSLNLMEAL